MSITDRKPIEVIRHSASHVLAAAIMHRFPDARLDRDRITDSGFSCDVDFGTEISSDDLPAIENEMLRIVTECRKFEHMMVPRDEAEKIMRDLCRRRGGNGLMDRCTVGGDVSLYRIGDYMDPCVGPHVDNTSEIGSFKLFHVGKAYNRGEKFNAQITRVSGTTFYTKRELDEFMRKRELAAFREHSKIGGEMDLFVVDDSVGKGLVLWTGKGGVIRQQLMNFILENLGVHGYEQVFTPQIGKVSLFGTSGHIPHYESEMFPPMTDGESERDQYILRPMNCPMHALLFASRTRSYRELPLRFAEFGTVYRWEPPSELCGITRVRGFTQDDAHIFAAEEQLVDEISNCLNLIKYSLRIFGLDESGSTLGLRGSDHADYVGSEENWAKAEAALRAAAEGLGIALSEIRGEAAFYGPKISFVVKDSIGREWQLGTVQVDYNLPERFKLEYIGADNKPHRPVMIHRAPFGSLERFTGVLIEHFGGDFPTWLAPEQVRILTITDEQNAFAGELLNKLKAEGIRATLDGDSDKLGAKIRKAETDKIPWMLVVGKNEAAENCVTVRSRIAKSKEGKKTVDEAIALIKDAIVTRALPEAPAKAE